jgi:hypothetical protein
MAGLKKWSKTTGPGAKWAKKTGPGAKYAKKASRPKAIKKPSAMSRKPTTRGGKAIVNWSKKQGNFAAWATKVGKR